MEEGEEEVSSNADDQNAEEDGDKFDNDNPENPEILSNKQDFSNQPDAGNEEESGEGEESGEEEPSSEVNEDV